MSPRIEEALSPCLGVGLLCRFDQIDQSLRIVGFDPIDAHIDRRLNLVDIVDRVDPGRNPACCAAS